jgi:translation elongation factor EF-1alpha
MSELKELPWEQQGNEVTISIEKESGESIKFILDDKIINFLASNTPKMYVFYVELNNEKEKSWLVDFNRLKSIVSNQNSLKISIGKQKQKIQYIGISSKGKYCIARGESYHERHLNEKGWQHQRNYFDIFDINEVKSAKKVETPIINKVEEKTEIQENKSSSQSKGGKLKECIKCAEIIPSKLEICPYCDANQNIQKDDDMIDISI